MKLILGTAEWNPEGYNNVPSPSITEIRHILGLAKEAGINILDTAESYNCQDVIRKEAKGFCIYTKTRDWKVTLDWGKNELRGILYHYKQAEPKVDMPFIHRWVNIGSSVYTKEQLPDEKQILQVPFNINNTEFVSCFDTHRTVFVRSVFNRGDLLRVYSIRQCLDFVKGHRADGIIIGVKTEKELGEILSAY